MKNQVKVMSTKIAIRVDSATMIGSGHVMRCLTLAERLRKHDVEVIFICRNLPGNIIQLVRDKLFTVHVFSIYGSSQSNSVDEFLIGLKQDSANDWQLTCDILVKYGPFDWVVVDHYALDEKWESAIRPHTRSIWVIDDLADRPHNCDVLLDQNYHADMKTRYNELVPPSCKQLLGPKYLLLREEFFHAQYNRRHRDGRLHRVLVFFGGGDHTNETGKTLHAIRQLNQPNIHFDIVVGKSNVHLSEVKTLCDLMTNVHFHCQIDYMAQLMNEADLAIGAGGSTTWERCFLGLPALIVILAENQRQGIEKLESSGAFINLGWYSNIDSNKLCESIKHIIHRPDLLRAMNVNALELVGVRNKEYRDELVTEFGLV